jgi:hypothetical protein
MGLDERVLLLRLLRMLRVMRLTALSVLLKGECEGTEWDCWGRLRHVLEPCACDVLEGTGGVCGPGKRWAMGGKRYRKRRIETEGVHRVEWLAKF